MLSRCLPVRDTPRLHAMRADAGRIRSRYLLHSQILELELWHGPQRASVCRRSEEKASSCCSPAGCEKRRELPERAADEGQRHGSKEGVNELPGARTPLLSQEGWPEGPGWFQANL